MQIQLFNNKSANKNAVNSILEYNKITKEKGLFLTQEQTKELVQTRNTALASTGRIEFGDGIIGKIILEFFDSPYITPENYAKTLYELTEIFYYYKNETLDIISDDELIKIMAKSFNGPCEGSTELLSDRELDKISRNIRSGQVSNNLE